jgi:hypothetical protein
MAIVARAGGYQVMAAFDAYCWFRHCNSLGFCFCFAGRATHSGYNRQCQQSGDQRSFGF